MNLYGQILSITLGGLLSISEILPFIRNVKTNGILHFLLSSLIKDAIEYEQQNENEHESCTTQQLNEHIVSDLESQPLLHSHKKKPHEDENESDPCTRQDVQHCTRQDNENNLKYNESFEELLNVNTNIQNDIIYIKKELYDDNIKSDLNVIVEELKSLKQDKESYSSKNVQDIVEMILQHLKDLQRTQSQWIDNYGENNLKNDIKLQNILDKMNIVKDIFRETTDTILEKIHKLKELMYESAEEYNQHESNNINTNIISKELIHQTIHEFFENKHLITNSASLDTEKLIVDVNTTLNTSLKQHLEVQIAE